MGWLKTVPELAKVNGKWVMENFAPTNPAWDWPEFQGKTGTIYVVGYAGHHKIGLTRNFAKRFVNLQAGVPTQLDRVATRSVPLAGMAYAEAWLHEQHAAKRTFGEWFAISSDEAVALLSKAVVRAKTYEKRCREWYFERQEAERSGPLREKMDREYAEFRQRIDNAEGPSAPRIAALVRELLDGRE